MTSRIKSDLSPDDTYDVIVVGAGFAGMYMLHKLRQLGLRVRVFDTATDVGGTWYWNRYPGARCDVVSMDYSYSFSDEIQQEWTWSEKYAPQPEILGYAQFVADKLDLRRDIQFETRIAAMVYDDAACTWTVTTTEQQAFVARYCIMATGCLSIPKEPQIPGLSNFNGPVYSTSRWPHEDVDLSGKRVGLIGTGSSGIQAAPELAKSAERLFIFQRTPSFTLPARNEPLEADFIKSIKDRYMERREEARRHPAGHLRPITDRKTFGMPETERRERFEYAWQSGGMAMFGEFGDLLVDKEANDEITQFVFEKIDEIIDDPQIADKLKPRGLPFAGRRICLDTDFYEMFNRDNVELVDVSADPMRQVVATGVETASGVVELDALVLAVGFDAMTGALLAIDIRGKGGWSLRDKWDHGPVSYLGLAMAGFPNLFTITGPGSPSVLSNVIASIEQHVEWLTLLIGHMQESGLIEIEADSTAEEEWVRYNYDLAKGSLMMTANSWYLGANIPGKPQVFMPFSGGLNVYRDICNGIAAQGYRGFHFTDAEHHEGRVHSAPADIRP